jgi:Flp pilus assembly protein TadG
MTEGTPRRRDIRRGAAAVEFAIVAPVLFLFLFASIEFARLNMLRNSIENAAYEGARRGIVPGATTDDVTAESLRVLREIGIKNGQVSVSPNVITATTTDLTVTVNVPLNGTQWLFCVSRKGTVLSRSVALKRESI